MSRNMNTSNSSSYNPFQKQNNRNQYRSEGSGGYGAWKNKTAAASQPKEKVLTAADFPLLPGATPGAKPVNTKEMPETSMAARMKEVLEEEEEQKRLRQLKEKDDFELHVIPLSSWMHSKYLAEKRERERKRREIEEEEENYRWQISRDMTYTREDDDYTEPYEELPPLEEAEDSQQYELEEVA